jgi:CTP synthase (UTP-ammonia lyase)
VQGEWLPTATLEQLSVQQLSGFDALWCVPASPYASMDGALKAIQFAREKGVPFLGTCAGFQHALIEYARNVLAMTDADHEETKPDAACALISRLSSPMVEKEGRVLFREGSRLREIYGRDSSTEAYHCNFGLGRGHEAMLNDGLLRVSARDSAGGVHAVELADHPFFMATLFQPERLSLQSHIHPIIRAFVQAALAKKRDAVARRQPVTKVQESNPEN